MCWARTILLHSTNFPARLRGARRRRTPLSRDDDRRDETWRWRESLHAPATMLAGAPPKAHDPRRLAGGERDIEALERVPKPIANRLDESLLARPAVEESERPVACGKGEIGFVLPRGKAARGGLVGIRQLANGFDID